MSREFEDRKSYQDELMAEAIAIGKFAEQNGYLNPLSIQHVQQRRKLKIPAIREVLAKY